MILRSRRKRVVLRSHGKITILRSRGTPPMRGVDSTLLPAATHLQAITHQGCPQARITNDHRTMAVTGATGAGTLGVDLP